MKRLFIFPSESKLLPVKSTAETTILSRAHTLFSSLGAFIYFLIYALPDRLSTCIHSALLANLFRSTGLSIHHSARIIGLPFITVGCYFWAGPRLWLHAVSTYQGFRYSPRIVIGSRFGCSESVHIAAINAITIGDNVLVGSHVLITDHNHGIYNSSISATNPDSPPISRPLSGQPVIIGNNVFIGDNVKILPGAFIPDGTVIGCNSVVTGSLPHHSICAGSPARPLKYYNGPASGWISSPQSIRR
jgi:acetyltransferase-like isoleucine patch superfamily enzyme